MTAKKATRGTGTQNGIPMTQNISSRRARLVNGARMAACAPPAVSAHLPIVLFASGNRVRTSRRSRVTVYKQPSADSQGDDGVEAEHSEPGPWRKEVRALCRL